MLSLQEVETKVADAVKELALFRSVTESNLSEIETEIDGFLTAEYLEVRSICVWNYFAVFYFLNGV